MLTPSLDDPRFESLLLDLHAVIDVCGFWTTVPLLLDKVVLNDACVLYLNHPEFSKTWCASKTPTTPKANEPRDWTQLRGQVDMMMAFVLSHPGRKLCLLSEVVPDSRGLSCSAPLRRYTAEERRHYTASLLFWQDGKLASQIAIHRTAEQGDFTQEEMALLNRLHSHIEATLQRLSTLEVLGKRHPLAASRLDEVFARLTHAEHEIVPLMREGFSNREIAARLDKSIRTVKTQLTSIYKKFDVRSRSRLLAILA